MIRSINRRLVILAIPFVVASCGRSNSPTGPTTNCALTVPQTTIEVPFAGGAQNIFVSTTPTCAWTATTNQSFISITSGSGQTGPGSVTFTVAENTGAARQATITIGSVAVTVNQAAGPPAITFAQPALPAAVVGSAYSFQFSASGGVGAIRFAVQSGTFAPIGMAVNANGVLSGTPVAPGTSTFGVCASDDTGRSLCRAITLVVNPGGTTDSPILGNWAGNITVNTGCVPGLPRTVTWSGTFRRAANNSLELVASIPAVGVSNETVPVILSGTALQFSITVDSRYDFTAQVTPDFRSLSGSFTAGACAAGINPSGTWNGTKQ
jgi:hypothetical protein